MRKKKQKYGIENYKLSRNIESTFNLANWMKLNEKTDHTIRIYSTCSVQICVYNRIYDSTTISSAADLHSL